MIVTEYIKLANTEATGETDTPSTGSEAYVALYDQVNILIGAWQDAVDSADNPIDWDSLWGRKTLSNVIVADEDTFDVDAGLVRYLSSEEEGFKIRTADGQYRTYKVVKPSELSGGQYRVAFQNDKLIFAEPFSSDDQFIGGSISFAYYGFATKIGANTPSATIPVDDPYWVVYRGAAALARNDYVKGGQYNNLLNLAKEKWDAMVKKNKRTSNNTVNHGNSRVMFPGVG